jgi:hypothetical protein
MQRETHLQGGVRVNLIFISFSDIVYTRWLVHEDALRFLLATTPNPYAPTLRPYFDPRSMDPEHGIS